MPLAIANTFLIKLIIIRPTSIASSLINCLEVQPSRLSTLTPFIIISLANSHYSGSHVRDIAFALSSHTAVSASPTLPHTATYATTSPIQTSSTATSALASCVCITHCNVQSLLGHRHKTMTCGTHSKIDKLRSLLLLARHPPIFCATETKLFSDDDDFELSLHYFVVIAVDMVAASPYTAANL